MSKSTRAWTPSDDATLARRYRKGSVTKLALDLGRTERALHNRAQVLRIEQKKTNHPATIGKVFENVIVPELNWVRRAAPSSAT